MIRDEVFELNTQSKGEAEVETNFLNGFLSGFYFTCEKQINIQVILKGTGLIVFEKKAFQGKNFFPIVMRPFGEDATAANYQGVPLALNDKLLIRIHGNVATQVNGFARYDDKSVPEVDDA